MPRLINNSILGVIGVVGAVTAMASPGMEEAAMETTQALKLERLSHPGGVEILVIGYSDSAVEVSYKLDVIGNSTTRHSGKTRLSPGVEATLSRVKVGTDGDWCAVLDVDQGSHHYTLRQGICAQDQ